MFTQDQLNEVFTLDRFTGFLYWKYNNRRADHFSGKYRRVWWGGQKYYVHHIVWCMIYGNWPDQIDHINTDGEDNRPENLRESTQAQNRYNATYGPLRGVESHGAKWRARIQVNGKRIELGSYASREEAITAYEAGAEKYFGEFAEHNRP